MARNTPLGYPIYGLFFALVFGIAFGLLDPKHAAFLHIVSSLFITIIKMMIAPLVFCMLVLSIINHTQNQNDPWIGRVSLKSLVYFELITTIALVFGLLVPHWMQLGSGLHLSINTLDTSLLSNYMPNQSAHSIKDFLSNLVPQSFLGAFTDSGNLLQVLFLAILAGYAAQKIKRNKARELKIIHSLLSGSMELLIEMMRVIIHFIPFVVFCGISGTIGQFGAHSLVSLMSIVLFMYVMIVFFSVVILGAVGLCCGFSIFHIVYSIRSEIMMAFAVSSSEVALVPLMRRLVGMGYPKHIVHFVIPLGYSFNLGASGLYMTAMTIFLSQALNIHLTIHQQLFFLMICLLTSKGSAAVTGGALVTLAATFLIVPYIPISALSLVVGIHFLLAPILSVGNLIGNSVAAAVLTRWEKNSISKVPDEANCTHIVNE